MNRPRRAHRNGPRPATRLARLQWAGRRCLRDESGHAMVELVLSAPFFLLAILVGIELFMMQISTAVARAVVTSSVETTRRFDGTPAEGQRSAREASEQLGGRLLLTGLQVRVTRTAATATVHVQATAAAPIPLPLAMSATAPVETPRPGR